MPSLTISPQKPKSAATLALWMERVLEECDRASRELSPDAVHDLRVALRRCRSIADGIMGMDPDPEWKKMKKSGKRLFSSLGALRDVHVMQEWALRLGTPGDPLGNALLTSLRSRENELQTEAAKAVTAFDRKAWKRWAVALPRRTAHLRKGSDIFQHLALERWTEAYELHRRALRNRSQVALHNLRIGLKRFRYSVENFLPKQHAAWADDLKGLQDILGEVHDLDVFRSALRQVSPEDEATKSHWQEKIAVERGQRIAAYRHKMIGKKSLWQVWRAGLPAEQRVREAANKRLRLWASFFEPDLRHSDHVAELATQLSHGLPKLRHLPDTTEETEILRIAALLHEIGKAKVQNKYEKATYKLIQQREPPLGWSAESWRMIGIIARFHRRDLPVSRHKSLRGLTRQERNHAYRLAGILRLAEALDNNRDLSIGRVEVRPQEGIIVIAADGYSTRHRNAESIAAARHLLEIVYKRPIMIRRLASAGNRAA